MSDLLPASRRRPPDHRLTPGAVMLFVFCGVTLAIAIRMTGYYDQRQSAAAGVAVSAPGRIVGATR